ncbi:hypothetical protein [Gottfriedia acidiceleris]|uniref:hypothetical protein n=1 Tax=Gottfriedia acidiceleris TaxID=371036 RepID=UPI00101CE994|nr:hypothetical protein [Gottfriedia acidiceleris]
MKKIIGYIIPFLIVVLISEFLDSKGFISKPSGDYSWVMIIIIGLLTILIVFRVLKNKKK